MFEDVGFRDFKISVKHHDVITMVQTTGCSHPRAIAAASGSHRGGAGMAGHHQVMPRVRRAAGRRHRRHDPRVPVRTARRGGQGRLQAAGVHGTAQAQVRHHLMPELRSRQVDVIQLANAVTEELKNVTAPIRVAVMGCIVNGPGEAREADLGVASGNGKGQIFIKGKVIETVPGRPDRRDAARAGQRHRRPDGGRRTGAGSAAGPVVIPIQHPNAMNAVR